jgi:hypothetical protein
MQRRQFKSLGLIGVAVLIAIQIACGKGGQNIAKDNPHRVVTISAVSSNGSNPCEVDFPVTLLRTSKHHTIAWIGADHEYWIWFDNGFPIVNATNPIHVPNGTSTLAYDVTAPTETYFTYAIYDSNPGSNPPSNTACKKSSDDHDTGLNVKP